MIDDVRPPQPRQRPKPRVILPLPKPEAVPLHEQAKAVEPSFRTPEDIAAETASTTEPVIVDHTAKQVWYRRLRPAWPPTRKQSIVYGALAVILAFGIGAGWTLTHHKRAVVAASPKKSITRKPVVAAPIYSTLSGQQITDASLNKKPVTAVMVENSLDARPQSGLSDAGIVYEAVAEGGVTRFMAVYQDTTPTNVGPIRSARPYYIQWALGYNAAYAHVGGSDDALSDITAWGVQDMNQFYNGSYYHRTADRDAPHNVYTGIDTLNQLEAAKGYTSSYTGFTRTKDTPKQQPDVTSIDLSLSGQLYDPHYVYNPTTNSYDRSEAGEAHIDANTGKQLSPKVVVALVVPLERGALDSSGAYYSNYNVLGSGTAYVFQNGTVITASWNKADNKSSLSLIDANNQPVALNRGQTWITAVSSTAGVHYQ
jgi:hypothetical protein